MLHCVLPCSKRSKASIWLSGIGEGRPWEPAKPSTPVVRKISSCWSRLSRTRTKIYPGNSGAVMLLLRSLQRRTCLSSGTKISVPRSRSSDATFFSKRKCVWMAYQAACGMVAVTGARSTRRIAPPLRSHSPAVEIFLVTACNRALPVWGTSDPSGSSPIPVLSPPAKFLNSFVPRPCAYGAPVRSG